MIIAAEYSFNNGKKYVEKNFAPLLKEVKSVIHQVDSSQCLTKTSKEITMKGKQLYSPRDLNNSFKNEFTKYDWFSHKETCHYSTNYYTDAYKAKPLNPGAFRDMDFVKDGRNNETLNRGP